MFVFLVRITNIRGSYDELFFVNDEEKNSYDELFFFPFVMIFVLRTMTNTTNIRHDEYGDERMTNDEYDDENGDERVTNGLRTWFVMCS